MDNLEPVLSTALNKMASEGPIIYMHWRVSGNKPVIDQITPNIHKTLGYSQHELVSGQVALITLIHKEDRLNFLNPTVKPPFWETTARIYSKDGQLKFMKLYNYIDQPIEEAEATYISALIDLSVIQEEFALKQTIEQRRLASAIDSAREGVWDLNTQNGAIFFSKHWKGMLGYEEHEFPNKLEEWSKRVHPGDLDLANYHISQHVLNKTKFYEAEYRLLHKDGTYRWILDRGKAIERDGNGVAIRMIGTHVDITEQKRMKQMLKERNAELERLVEQTREMAATDPLTSLFNRRKMMEEIRVAKNKFDTCCQPFTLAILDLDHFKQINDRYGHVFGDIALQTFADLLKRKVKSPNVIARWGGEEFIILFAGKTMMQSQQILLSLQACCNEELLKYRAESVIMSFSAGLCEYNSSMREDLIKNADKALYLAKSQGRNQVVIYKKGLPVS